MGVNLSRREGKVKQSGTEQGKKNKVLFRNSTKNNKITKKYRTEVQFISVT